jgi:diguanylate cyclase (GGDEF)-like protein
VSIFRSLSSQILIDLRELEGDFRASTLKADKAQSLAYMAFAGVAALGMLAVDWGLFAGRIDLFLWTAIYRGVFVLITSLMVLAVSRTMRVRTFDRYITGWVSFTIVFLLFFNFTRPANYVATAFDIIVVFAIYVLSPLKFKTNLFLAVGFSLGIVCIDYFVRRGVDPNILNSALAAHITVHALGLGSAVQLQSYRRRSFKALIEERDAREMVAYLANIDPLTKSLTRRQFFNIAESEFRRFARYQRPLSTLVIDADLFKNINDTYGHHAGDVVLRSLSLVVLEQKRAQDTFGRLGGEEFGLILPETNLEQARVVAERIRAEWEKTPSNMDGTLIKSTASVGVTEARPGDQSFEDVLRRADLMMYKAKEQGRNKVASA